MKLQAVGGAVGLLGGLGVGLLGGLGVGLSCRDVGVAAGLGRGFLGRSGAVFKPHWAKHLPSQTLSQTEKLTRFMTLYCE
ncbi:hypothetical protein HMPREF2960_08430 [Corynebacterium sp. HMSC070B05]|nr:hypothetical protein HMPREF2960_08430 [Corynebacterium sp. HMSC070B05]